MIRLLLTSTNSLLVLSAALAACTGGKLGKGTAGGVVVQPEGPKDDGPSVPGIVPPSHEAPKSQGITPEERLQQKLDTVTPATTEDVSSFLINHCKGCHESGGPYASYWSLNFEDLSTETIRSDTDAHVTFQAILNKVEGYATPKAMPYDTENNPLSDQAESEFLRVTKWYIQNAPEVVINAYLEYEHVNPFGEGVNVLFDYTCKSPVQGKTFLARLTLDAFGRYPNEGDQKLISNLEIDLDRPLSAEQRKQIADQLLLDQDWRDEFLRTGLRNFASKLSGANDIQPAADQDAIGEARGIDALRPGLTEAEVEGLREEFYQLLLSNIGEDGKEIVPYKDLLLGNEIPVSAATKSLYSCDKISPRPGEWLMCDMTTGHDLRMSYFTSYSFLAAKPSSFLHVNNNYGRVAMMYFFVRGEPLKAATDGPKGEAVKELPSCLISKDTRGQQLDVGSFAATGTIQIPNVGNSCQGCHIYRNLASGSILFRSFGWWGQRLMAGDFSGALFDPELIPGVTEALEFEKRSIATPLDEETNRQVTVDFLASLLPVSGTDLNGEQACIVSDGSETIISNVAELARHLIGDGRELARGLARHIPRGLSNINSTNPELIQEMERAYQEGDERLLPLFSAYFASETFACGNKE